MSSLCSGSLAQHCSHLGPHKIQLVTSLYPPPPFFMLKVSSMFWALTSVLVVPSFQEPHHSSMFFPNHMTKVFKFLGLLGCPLDAARHEHQAGIMSLINQQTTSIPVVVSCKVYSRGISECLWMCSMCNDDDMLTNCCIWVQKLRFSSLMTEQMSAFRIFLSKCAFFFKRKGKNYIYHCVRHIVCSYNQKVHAIQI